MKFSTSFFLSCLATSAYARVAGNDARSFYVEERDLATITGVLSKVDTGINNLDTAVKAYTGGSGTNIISVANTLISTINAGKTTVDGQPQLSLADSLALQGPVKTITNSATTLVDDLTAKRSLIISNKLCATTRGLVTKIDSSANALIDSVVSKVPAAAQGIAEGLVADLKAVLAKAKANFSTANCPS